MKCKSVTTSVSSKTGRKYWYNYRNRFGKELGYLCRICYDDLRRGGQLLYPFKQRLNQRLCSNCDSNHTLVTTQKEKYPHSRWYKDGKGGWWCNKCHHKIVFTPEIRKVWNSRRMKFKDKIISLTVNPRKGICSWCGFKGITHMHHIQYHKDNPLKDAIELCISCHAKETRRLDKRHIGVAS